MIDIDKIKPYLHNAKFGSSNQLVSDCPFCGKKGHFYINRTTFLWICHSGKCNETGNLFKLLRELNALHLIEGNQVDISSLKKLGEYLPIEGKGSLELPDSSLPVGFKKLEWNQKNVFVEYLKNRKYTEQDFEIYQPGYTDILFKLENYIVVPVYKNWSIKGYIARNILEDERLRYQNKEGVQFSNLIDGMDEVTFNTHFLIIVEGHFDKISVSTELNLHQQEEFKCIATYGKKLSVLQMEMILNTNVEVLYFLYDMSDAIRQIKFYGNKLKSKIKVYGCFENTFKDAGKMNQKEIFNVLMEAQPIENFTYNIVQFKQLQ